MFSSSTISYYIISLGCAKNLTDSEYLNGMLKAAGYRTTESAEDADIIIINTCGFITPAKEESIEVILDAVAEVHGEKSELIKEEGPREFSSSQSETFRRKIVATGCLTQRYFHEIKNKLPEIDFIYGLIDDKFVNEMSLAFNIEITREPQTGRVPLLEGLLYSYIKIAEGCSNKCSYCAIPLIRGGHRSRSPESILSDAANAANQGALELVIVAQDISAYTWRGTDLYELIYSISQIDKVQWIRLMYCHPDHIDEHIMRIFIDIDKVVHYIDLPFQHASEKILKSMGRQGNGEIYLNLLKRIRQTVPDMRIRSSFLVGYPGESDGDFMELLNFIEQAGLDRAGAFLYSPEEGTRAFSLGNPVPHRVKNRRYKRLMKLQESISERKLSGMIGTTVRVMLEERVDDRTYVGRTEYDAPEVDGFFYLTVTDSSHNADVSIPHVLPPIVRARVIDTMEHDLMGELV